MSRNRSGEIIFFMEPCLSFTPAGRAHMARCRFAPSEYELVEQAMRKGCLLLTDAALAHAIPGRTGTSIVKRSFPRGRPSGGVRLLFLYRRRCEQQNRPFVVLNRHNGRAALLAEVPGPGRAFAPDERERVTSVLKAHQLGEHVDASRSFQGSCFFCSALPDLATLPTVAFRLFETLLDIMMMRAGIARGEASEPVDAATGRTGVVTVVEDGDGRTKISVDAMTFDVDALVEFDSDVQGYNRRRRRIEHGVVVGLFVPLEEGGKQLRDVINKSDWSVWNRRAELVAIAEAAKAQGEAANANVKVLKALMAACEEFKNNFPDVAKQNIRRLCDGIEQSIGRFPLTSAESDALTSLVQKHADEAFAGITHVIRTTIDQLTQAWPTSRRKGPTQKD
jgi:hypothetical protein